MKPRWGLLKLEAIDVPNIVVGLEEGEIGRADDSGSSILVSSLSISFLFFCDTESTFCSRTNLGFSIANLEPFWL